jgi:dihydroorotate dehydrogenase
MPDWSYHPLFKPVLSRLPGSQGREFIHRGMSLISSLPGGTRFIEFLGHMNPSHELQKEILGLSISNPIGLSGMVDPLLTGTKAFSNLGFGFIEVGPVTVNPNKPSCQVTYNEERNNILYPSQLESIGVMETLKKLKALSPSKKPIFVRIDHAGTYKEQLSIVETLIEYGDAFIIEENMSISEWEGFGNAVGSKPLLYSVPHDECSNARISQLIDKKLIDGIIIEEQSKIIDDKKIRPLNQVESIGQVVTTIKQGELAHIPLIVSGGIHEPKDALLFFEKGADLVMLSGGYVLSGPGLPKRINEGLIDVKDNRGEESNGWRGYWLFGFIMFLAGFIALIISMTVIVLPYDEVFLELSREQLHALNPNILKFMSHDRMTLSGTMMSGGFLYMQLARHGVRYGIHWAKKAINVAAIIGFLGILLFIGYGYFDWLHGLFWCVLFPFFYVGYKQSSNVKESSRSKNRSNHPAWKKSLLGQLAFIILGISFVLGGLVISTIGETNVFVSTDILYICMTPEQLNEITGKLIPVIAHDRAGFGSALISVGALVLMLALWGFHQGEKWVWYTFLIGGLPAFCAGIFTHFAIGYTTFFHLLPAYFAVFLYIAGLVLSRRFLFEEERM